MRTLGQLTLLALFLTACYVAAPILITDLLAGVAVILQPLVNYIKEMK